MIASAFNLFITIDNKLKAMRLERFKKDMNVKDRAKDSGDYSVADRKSTTVTDTEQGIPKEAETNKGKENASGEIKNNEGNTSNKPQNNGSVSILGVNPQEALEFWEAQVEVLAKQGASQDEIRQKIKEWALEMIKAGAIYSHDRPATLTEADCSGTVQFIFLKTAGIKLDKWITADALYKFAKEKNAFIDKNNLQPGDVVIWWTPELNDAKTHWTHIQIYLGDITALNRDGKMVTFKDAILNAPRPGRALYIESLATYTGWMTKEGWRSVYANILAPLSE